MNNSREINMLTFSHLVELGQIAVDKGGVPRSIIEKMLEQIALENELTPPLLW